MINFSRMKQAEEVKRATWISVSVNLSLSGLKLACGILGKSQVVVADAVHSLSDLVTDAAILIGVRYWSKPADECHPHGHQRIETIITVVIGLVLAGVATGILWNAAVTLHDGHKTTPGWIAFGAVLVSIICKELLYRWTISVGTRIKSMPLVANAWHQRSDALSSIPAAIAVAVAAISPEWSFVDHVGAVIVSLFIYQAAFKIVRPCLAVLCDSGAPKKDVLKIEGIARGIAGVLGVHKIRTRHVGSSNLSVDLHVQVNRHETVERGHEISGIVKTQLIKKGPSILDVVVHIEPYDK